MIMKYSEFFQTVRELKMTISDSFLPLCYCIYISKDLKKCVVKSNLTTWDMTDVSYFILVGMYKWQNFTYINSNWVLLGIFNDKLEPINSIKFKKIEFISNLFKSLPKMFSLFPYNGKTLRIKYRLFNRKVLTNCRLYMENGKQETELNKKSTRHLFLSC